MNVKYENIDNNDTKLSLHCILTGNISDLVPYPHIHDELEIVYILSGELSANINDNSCVLKKDSIIILNRLCPHQFFINKTASVLLLQFKPSKIYDNKQIDLKYLEPFFHTHEFKYFIGSCDTPLLGKMAKTLHEIEKSIALRDTAYDLAVQVSLIQLLYLMHRAGIFNISTSDTNKHKQALHQLNYLLKYLDSHYSEDITLKQASDMVQLDYHYFSRLFKEQTGKTFTEYLSVIRIFNAQKLLCKTDYPISFVAESVGIPNTSYFNRMFKNQNEITPTEYRNCRGVFKK